MADTVATRKKPRRKNRGSGTSVLEAEISKLVRNELQKYEKQLKRLTDMQNAPHCRRQTDTQPTKIKNKTPPKSKVLAHTRRDSAHSSRNNRTTNENRPLNKNGQIGDNIKSQLMHRVLNEIAALKITSSDFKNNLDSPHSLGSKSSGFPKSISQEKMREILKGNTKAAQHYITGTFKVNSKNPKFAYVSTDDKDDIYINGFADRNRAMDRDIVVIQLHEEDRWITKENGHVQKTAFVVSILEKLHPRKAIGILVYDKDVLKFHARDPKFPMMRIHSQNLDEEFKSRDKIKKTLFIVKMEHWPTPTQCFGKILGKIGPAGDLQTETHAILLENSLDVTPYDTNLYEHLPGPDYTLQDADSAGREDWRLNCVFTIDPATAVDLDDAVSCRKLENGNFEVGVHIADVTYFLEASSLLDEMVSKRATTVYLANTAYHMLPQSLCQLCSLLPGKDRLTFSVIWELTPIGEIISHRFTRSVINSCFQMSYHQAQKIIENPDFDGAEVGLLNVKNGFTAPDICKSVNYLFSISQSLRSNRFESGALKIDQPKIHIILDEATKLPISYCLEERLESNNLIEEFMLLANMTVANHLYKKFPQTALLRHHELPNQEILSRSLHTLKNFGVHLNSKSTRTLQMSKSQYEQTIDKGQEHSDEDFVGHCRMMVINSLCAQGMARANYICSGVVKQKSSLRHYALNVPMYTHFTSPIRRYSDCIVHRLLASDLQETSFLPEDWSQDSCVQIAKRCNEMKNNAKNAQERSNEIYFIHLIASNGPIEQLAIVMRVRQHSLDIILCNVGLTLKVELSEIQQNLNTIEYSDEDCGIKISWKEPEVIQVINVFTLLNVRVRKHPKHYRIQASLLPPKMKF